jgi:hypothetical protein
VRIIGLRHLTKLKKKNIGNIKLVKAIDKLITDIKKSPKGDEFLEIREDADCIHNEGFYFFDINIHRTMILIEYVEIEEDNEDEKDTANILWVGSHDDYERTFQNNKNTINKWLKNKNHID